MTNTAHCKFWLIGLVFCLIPSGFAQTQPSRPSGAFVSDVVELASSLAAAKTDDERAALLGAKKELQTPELAQALIGQGNRLRNQRNYSQALIICQLAQQIAERLGDSAIVAATLSNLGDIHRIRGKQDIALEHYRKSLALYEALGNKAGIASALLSIGFSYSAQGNFALALEYYQKSFAIPEMLNNWNLASWAQSIVGDTYRLQKNYSLALEAYQKALTLFGVSGNLAGLTRVLNNMELVYTALGKDNLARDEELRQAGRNSATDFSALQKLADRLTAAETDEERKTLMDAEKTLAPRELAGVLTMRGGQLRLQRNYSKAISSYRVAAQIDERIGDKLAVASALTSIGSLYRAQGRALMAQEYYQNSLTLLEKMGIQAAAAELLDRLGNISYIQQNYGLALWYFRKAVASHEMTGNKNMASAELSNLGMVYTAMRHYDQASECLKQSLAHFEVADDMGGVAWTLHRFVNLYILQGKFELARQCAQRSLARYEETGIENMVADLRRDLARIDQKQGHYASAIEHYQKSIAQYEALGASQELPITYPLQKLAEIYYQQGDYRQALQMTERAAAIIQPLSIGFDSFMGRTIAGKAYRALNQPAQAQMAFDEAIANVETMRAQLQGDEQEGQHFFDDKISPYHEMVGLLVSRRQPAAALAYAERAKARTLLDLLRNDQADVVKAMTAEEQAQEQGLKTDLFLLNAELLRERQRQPADPARLAGLRARQQKARQAFETFQAGLYAAHPELKIQRGEAPVLRSEEIAALLPDARTALLEFVVAEEQTFFFVITRNNAGQSSDIELKAYPMAITAKELGARAEAFRQQLAKRAPEFGASARALYDLLLKPAAAQLQGKTALVIVPDGPLWELPFQALQSSSNHFLIEDCAISYAPSLTVLREMAKARKKPSGSQAALLALGNPALGQETVSRAKYVLMDEKLDPLPEAEAQVKTLGRLYGPRQSKIYTGAEAREERAKAEAGNYRILHLATHGVLNDASPMYSHLLLAQTGEPGKEAREDGLLEGWELMKLDLNADLVVLSACETARGRVGAGEGVIGLTWALFVAGCPRTVVSQWKVEAASTTELMVEFHRQLKGRMRNPSATLGAAQALRAAALKMLRGGRYRHPFWWAGFVVVGDGY